MEGEEIIAILRSVNLTLLGFAFLVTVCSYFLRSWRWIYFFRESPPTFSQSYQSLIVGFFMNNILPARLGELVRAHLGGKLTGKSRTTVLATIAGERLADGLMISLIFATLFPLAANAQEIAEGQNILIVAAGFALVAVGTALVLYKRQFIFTLLERLNGVFPGHLSSFTLVRIRRFIEGLEPIFSPSRLVIIGSMSLVIWSVELFVYFLVARAFSQEMTIGGLSLFLATVNFSSLIPAAPGGIGVIEAISTVVLTHIGIAEERALSMVASQHLIQYIVVGIPGLFFFLYQMRGKLPVVEQLEDERAQPEADSSAIKKKARIEEARRVALGDLDRHEEVELSVIVPAYNEEHRLSQTVLDALEYLDGQYGTYELIIVDDGSLDRTGRLVRQFERLSGNVKLLSCPVNRGKGFAVRLGVMNARGQRILFADADGATPIEELARLQGAINAGAHIAIGSRAMASSDTRVETVWYRKFMGRVFNGMVNFLLLPGIADTQCGFKLFLRPVARYIFSRQRADGYSFDVEILFLARKAGCRITEVPINWTNVPGSKVNLIADSAAMFADIVRFRVKEALGRYRLSPIEAILTETEGRSAP